MKFRLSTYYPDLFSRGDSTLQKHRLSGWTTVRLSRQTVKRLRSLMKDVEAVRAEDDKGRAHREVTLEYFLAALSHAQLETYVHPTTENPRKARAARLRRALGKRGRANANGA